MKTTILSCLFVAIVSLHGCIGCGGSKEFVKDDEQQIETEDERIMRLAMEIISQMETRRAIQRGEEPVPMIPVQSPASMPAPEKRTFGVESVEPGHRFVIFEADSATVTRLNIHKYGRVRQLSIIDGADRWQLTVSSRYNFDEVVNYLKSLK